jgi:hypothetical protein
MSDVVIGILATACGCSFFIILEKLCSIRSDIKDVSSDYLLIRKSHYDLLCKKSTIDKQPPPFYSEEDLPSNI